MFYYLFLFPLIQCIVLQNGLHCEVDNSVMDFELGMYLLNVNQGLRVSSFLVFCESMKIKELFELETYLYSRAI
jgi:hypothetical protein